MRHFLILTAFFSSLLASAQISVTSTSAQQSATAGAVYDSSFNFSADKFRLLIGQTIYFIPYSTKYPNPPQYLTDYYGLAPAHQKKHSNGGASAASIASRAPLVGGFVPRGHQKPENTNNYYKAKLVEDKENPHYETPASEILGKYFTIIDFIDSTKGEELRRFLIKLAHKDNPSDVFYYRFSSGEDEIRRGVYFTDFLVVGYYEKVKKQYVNSYFYLAPEINNIFENIKDLATGSYISLTDHNEKWQCYDVTLLDEESTLSLIPAILLKNEKGNRIATTFLDNTTATSKTTIALKKFFITEARHNQLVKDAQDSEDQKKQHKADIIKKYGPTNGNLINNHKLAIGMTKEMCIASWGEPESINTTTMSGLVHEQWVYSMTEYVYFENGILTAIQN